VVQVTARGENHRQSGPAANRFQSISRFCLALTLLTNTQNWSRNCLLYPEPLLFFTHPPVAPAGRALANPKSHLSGPLSARFVYNSHSVAR
jgi:hypothetical protein